MTTLPKSIEIDGESVGYISPSAIKTLLTCSQKYEYKYIKKLPDLFGIESSLGTIVHASLAWASERIIINNKVVEPNIVGADAAARTIAKLTNPEELKKLKKEPFDVKKLSAEAREMASEAWKSFLEKRLHPIKVESQVINRINDWALMGYIDLLYKNKDQEICLLDFKTSKRDKYKAERDHIFQLLSYVSALRQQGIDVKHVWLVYIIRGNKVQVKWFEVPLSESSLKWAHQITLDAKRVIDAGIFYPNPISAGALCSKAYCSFWDVCTGAEPWVKELAAMNKVVEEPVDT